MPMRVSWKGIKVGSESVELPLAKWSADLHESEATM